jgi:ribosomal protein S27AE
MIAGTILATPTTEEPALTDPTVTVTAGNAPCPQCGETVVVTAHITLGDGFDLHLCRRCDTGATAGGRLLAIMGLPYGEHPVDLFREFTMAWLYEGAARHGWYQMPHPRDPAA